MFELTEVFDLQAILTQSLQYARGDGVVPSPHVLNQEKDGSVIYTWDGPSPYNQRGPSVSHIGLYDPSTQANKILWINDSQININTCSVNLDRTLLAYTVCDTTSGQNKAVYRAFLAEIYPHKRVFSLNIERPHFLRVQFLYGSPGAKQEKMAHMLLFLHKESIGLYHIPLARVEKGIIMSDQPVTEQLVKRFIWCQWESQHQRLYYIVARRLNRHDTVSSAPNPVLSCLQFSQQSKHEHMLDLPLNLNFPNIKPNTRSNYLDLPFCQGIPDKFVNMAALSLSNGTLCMCYQHPFNLGNKVMEESTEVDIDYTIIMPHHARELQGSVCKVPWSVAEEARLCFSWLNDYLLVFLPGQFVHALNVSIEFEPCHHIILHKKSWQECLDEDERQHLGETFVKTVSPHQETALPLLRITSQTNVKDVGSGTSSTDTVFSADSPSTTGQVLQDLRMQFNEETNIKCRISMQGEDSEETSEKKVIDSIESKDQLKLNSGETEVKSGDSVGQSDEDFERTEVKQPIICSENLGLSDEDPDRTEVKLPIESVNDTTAKSPAFQDTSRNIVLTAKNERVSPTGPVKLNIVTNSSSHLGHLCPFFKNQSAHSFSCVFDCQSGKVYQVGVDTSLLVYLFSACYMSSTRLAILHYVIRHGKDLNILKQLFEMVANDCASPEVPVLMQEFLVGLTYSNLRRQVEKDIFKLLPFTTSETFRGAFEKINTGERLSRISYVSLHSINIGTKSVRERQQRRLAEDLWDNLCLHLRSRQLDQPKRFSQERVQHEYRNLIREIEKGNSQSALLQIEEKDSFLGKISARARRSMSLPAAVTAGRSDSVLGSVPPFLSEGKLHPQQNKLISLTERLFAAHLGKYLRKDSKIKVANVGKEYISCQMQQSKQLCHMLWSIRGPASHSDYIPLNERASLEEYELFQLFERFFVAVQELAYPVPPGFHTYFTLMGFRTLELSLFLQYVDRGVLMLTGEFVAQIMEDLSNDDDNAHIKLQIISRLPKPLAEECFQKWDHPIAYRHTAIQQVSVLLRDQNERERSQRSGQRMMSQSASFGTYDTQNGDGIGAVFHPLDTLLDLLHEREMDSGTGNHFTTFDPQFLRDVATYHTTHDLSTINF